MTCTSGHKRSQTKPDRSHTGRHDQSFVTAFLSAVGRPCQNRSRHRDELQPRDNSEGLINPSFLQEQRDLGSASTFQVTVHQSAESLHWGGGGGRMGHREKERGAPGIAARGRSRPTVGLPPFSARGSAVQ